MLVHQVLKTSPFTIRNKHFVPEQLIIRSLKSVTQNIQYIHNLHNYRTDLACFFKEMKDR